MRVIKEEEDLRTPAEIAWVEEAETVSQKSWEDLAEAKKNNESRLLTREEINELEPGSIVEFDSDNIFKQIIKKEKKVNNLKEELRKTAETWNASGKYDGTDFEGRYFITDTDLDEFAQYHGLCRENEDGGFDQTEIEKVCDCKLVYDFKGSNPARLFGECEVIFNIR